MFSKKLILLKQYNATCCCFNFHVSILQTGSAAHPSYSMGTDSSFPGVKRQGSKADQSPMSRKCRSIHHSPTCSIMHRANFIFTVFSCFYFTVGSQLKPQRGIYMQGKTMYKHFTYYTISKHNTGNIACRFHHEHRSQIKSIQFTFSQTRPFSKLFLQHQYPHRNTIRRASQTHTVNSTVAVGEFDYPIAMKATHLFVKKNLLTAMFLSLIWICYQKGSMK